MNKSIWFHYLDDSCREDGCTSWSDGDLLSPGPVHTPASLLTGIYKMMLIFVRKCAVVKTDKSIWKRKLEDSQS